ncbi:MAG: helix-turn-helix transcriptional regulator [Bacteroidales bacterium]|nr:helix-turn-helix transcriptional regulator [Bacteroidales bacterium]
MEDVYVLADEVILRKIGERLKAARLKQNITQQRLAEDSGVSLSSVKKIENGEIRSMDSFVRILRTLGKLEVLQPLVEEEQLSPSEYFELAQRTDLKQRKRAASKRKGTPKENIIKEETLW